MKTHRTSEASSPLHAVSEKGVGQESQSWAHPSHDVTRRDANFFFPMNSGGAVSTLVQPKLSADGASEANTGRPATEQSVLSVAEQASGYSMSDVNVHYNSEKPRMIGADAYAMGSDIHLGPGAEQHLPHEAWHVVQQKQGRVKPTIQAYGLEVNADSVLENEADRMGAEMMQRFSTQPRTENLQVPQGVTQPVIQGNTIPTNFGLFHSSALQETRTPYGEVGMQIAIAFHPEKADVDAKKIALSQSVKAIDKNGPLESDPELAKRIVPEGEAGAGYRLDRGPSENNPVYGAADLLPNQTLKDTPMDGNPDPKEETK
ncbi:MAG: DUF4157 domain-containing protein, partial [Bacteroidota bacterium]